MKSLYFKFFLLILILSSCITISKKQLKLNNFQEVKENKDSFENGKEIFDISLIEKKITAITLSKKKDKDFDFFDINYKIFFKFKSHKIKRIRCFLYDGENKIIFENKEVDFSYDANTKSLIFEISFISKFTHKKVNYNLFFESVDGELKEVKGELENKDFPYLDELFFGPIISQSMNGEIKVSLSIKVFISNCSTVRWTRLIPPKRDYFWELPCEKDGEYLKCEALVYDSKRKYIENGNYLLQINFGEYGLYQKEILLVDFLGNSYGENYGLPVIEKIRTDKNNLYIEYNFSKLIDEIEFSLYLKDSLLKGERILLGKYRTKYSDIISIKEIKESFIDKKGGKLKLITNYPYEIKIVLYSKEINGISYISISDYLAIKFSSFFIFF